MNKVALINLKLYAAMTVLAIGYKVLSPETDIGSLFAINGLIIAIMNLYLLDEK